MRYAVIIAGVALLLVASCVAAEPYVSVWGGEGAGVGTTSSWFGNVGLVRIPSAFAPPKGGVTVSGHWIDSDPDSTMVANVNYGLLDYVEVGGAWIDPPVGDATVIGNVKVRLPIAKWLDDVDLPDVAVGAFDITDEINRSLYVVASKTFKIDPDNANSPRLNLHLGFARNEFDGGPLDGLFGGVEASIMQRGLIQAEFDGDDFNADFRYNVTKKVSVDVGVLDGDLGAGATFRSPF